jgi:hypothetical protein
VIELGFEAFDARRARVEAAARSIVAMCREDRFGVGWRPKGVDEVAILLESLGYSPEVVTDLWYDSLFALAADVSVAIDQYVNDEELATPTTTAWFRRACRDYAVGALYSGPWIIAVLGLAVFGSALWSSLSTPPHLATGIALGVYGALIVAGAFSQAIARRLTFYYLQDNAELMLWTLVRFVTASLVTFAVLGVAGWLVLRRSYGDPDAWLAASFFVGSGIFQTSLAPLYTVRRFAWIVGISAFATLLTGVTFAAGFHRSVDLPWEPATLAAEIGIVGLAVMAATVVWMRRDVRASAGGERLAPSTRAIVVSAWPYALFGTCYFTMIVADRIGAGLTAGWPFAYRSGYELGCDVALLAVVPVIGVVNVALESMPKRILAASGSPVADRGSFDGSMARFYARAALGVVAAAVVVVAGTDLLASFVLDRTILGLTGAAGAEARFVLRYAAAGYGALMLALLNCQFLFFLSRPSGAVGGSVAGALTCVAGCVALHLAGAPPPAYVFALDAGIGVFALATTLATVRTMRRFTFSYYAAY